MSVARLRVLNESLLRYPWKLIAMLWLVSFLNSADRSVVFAVMPQLRNQFALTTTQLAMISSVFFWIYAVSSLLSGRLSDRCSRSKMIVIGLAFWSLATGVASFSTGFAMLLTLRGVVALGESTYYPAATALISDWHARRMRSRALSLHQTGVFAGAGLGAFLAGVLADRFGWRIPFIVFGVVGLALSAILSKSLRDAPRRNVAPKSEPGMLPPRDMQSSPFKVVLARPPALYLCAVFFLGTGAATGVTVWAPTYVHDVMGLNLADSALYGSTSINLAGFLAVPLGGLLADSLAARHNLGRLYALVLGLGIAAVFLVPLLLAKSPATVGVVLLCSSIGKGIFDGCIYAAMHDVVPPQARATAVGLMTMCGFLGAGLTPLLVARSANFFGMATGLASLAALYFLAVAILLFTRGITHYWVAETRELELRTLV